MWTGLADQLVFNTSARDATGCAPRLTWYLTNGKFAYRPARLYRTRAVPNSPSAPDNTDYTLLQQVYARGHEIAVHTIDHLNPSTYTNAQWVVQTAGARDWTRKLMGGGSGTGRAVPTINGMRCPWLIFGGAEWDSLANNG